MCARRLPLAILVALATTIAAAAPPRLHAQRPQPTLGLAEPSPQPARSTTSTGSTKSTRSTTSTPTYTYRLAATWADAPWALTAGRYGHASDLSSAPDGTTYVLDLSYNAVHVIGADGRPQGVFAVPALQDGRIWAAVRLDVGFDGALHVLRRTPAVFGTVRTRVDVFAPDGTRGRGFETDFAYADLAIGPDGAVYLSAASGLPRVDVFDATGGRRASFGLDELSVPDALDVGADGVAYVVNRVPAPANPATPGPEPGPTEPSTQRIDKRIRGLGGLDRLGSGGVLDALREPGESGKGVDQPTAVASETPVATATPGERAGEGVVIFGADYGYRETVAFNGASDVAVGGAGVFVARDLEVFVLRQAEPVYAAPYPTRMSLFGGEPVHLDVAADGRLLASLWHCYFQGVVTLAEPGRRPARASYAGGIDAPPLEGPAFPLRIALGDGLAVMQGRFAIQGDRPDQTYHPASISPESEPQSVQRWSRAGDLADQLGLCAGGPFGAEVWWATDVAAEGSDVYTLDPRFIQRRADAHFPAWSYWPGELAAQGEESRLAALAADGGRVAAIDVGLGKVVMVDAGGTLVDAWSYADNGGSGSGAMPIDIALSGDRVYLAEGGRNRIAVRGMDGADLGTWPVHDGPLRIAASPRDAGGGGGDLFMLGRGGRAYRYGPDGRLVATWAMPDAAVEPLDIAAAADGRVWISFVKREPMREPRGSWVQAFTQAGVWVFEPAPGPDVDPPGAEGCLAWPDKTAAPAEIPLGDTVEVALAVDGHCPPRVAPAQIAIVLDTSRSMNGNSAIERAREAVLGLLARLDVDAVEVALVTFADGAALATPLGRDPAAVAARVAAAQAVGDTRMGAGIELARATLAGGRRDPPLRQIILMVTDGGFKDQPVADAERARAEGIEIYALVTRTAEFMGISSLAPVTGGRERVILDPDRWTLGEFAAKLVDTHSEDGLFATITVRDVIPANMRYVPDSAVPTAQYDPAQHTLTWVLDDVLVLEGLRLAYRLEPLEVGTWPTNVEAVADYRDALGREGRLVFPIPRVRVHAPPIHRAYLPFGAARACFRSGVGLDVVLVLDASQSMDEPAGDGRTKLAAARGAAGTFVDRLQLGRDRVAVVAFHDSARRAAGLTSRRDLLQAALDGLATSPGTRIDRGLAEARMALAEGGRRGARPVVILLTDGLQAAEAPPGAVQDEANRLKALGALIYTIGLGETIDRALLASVATRPEDYFESPSAGDLDRIYRQIVERLACAVP